MHYYIDGYNLMFRLLHDADSLTERRQQLIIDLNNKIQFLELDVTIVFDSQFLPGESTRGHFKQLEVLFSGYGETADDLIIEKVRAESKPKQVTVVTSDKKLAWFARRCDANTESVEHFIKWINQRHRNKLRKPLKKVGVVLTLPVIPVSESPTVASAPEECFDYYLKQFEEGLEKLEVPKPKPVEMEQKKQKHTKKPKKNLEREKGVSDMDRWLRIFEGKAQDQEKD